MKQWENNTSKRSKKFLDKFLTETYIRQIDYNKNCAFVGHFQKHNFFVIEYVY